MLLLVMFLKKLLVVLDFEAILVLGSGSRF